MYTIFRKITLPYLLPYFICCSSLIFAVNSSCRTWIAEDYVENGFLQFHWAKKFFFERYRWSGHEHVLDVGCGDGRITYLISKYIPNGKVLGMDSSLSMINYARQKHGDSSNLSFVLANAADIHFYECFDSQFDIVVSFHSLHWIDEQSNVLLGIKKALKPQGRAFLRLTSKGWDPIQEIADELINSDKWKPHFVTFEDPIHRFSIEEYLSLVKEAGLQPIQIEEIIEDDTLPNSEVLSKQIKSWLPHLKHLPIEFQSEFLKDIVTTYLIRVPPKEDGVIHLYDCYLEVEIIKL